MRASRYDKCMCAWNTHACIWVWAFCLMKTLFVWWRRFLFDEDANSSRCHTLFLSVIKKIISLMKTQPGRLLNYTCVLGDVNMHACVRVLLDMNMHACMCCKHLCIYETLMHTYTHIYVRNTHVYTKHSCIHTPMPVWWRCNSRNCNLAD